VTTGRAEGRSPSAFPMFPQEWGIEGADNQRCASQGGFRGHDEAWPSDNTRGFSPARERWSVLRFGGHSPPVTIRG
jgi:hypothetical protein